MGFKNESYLKIINKTMDGFKIYPEKYEHDVLFSSNTVEN
jgi:hypothetical protein